MPSLERLSKRFHAAGTNEHLDLSLTWQVSDGPFKRPCDQGAEIHGELRRVLLPFSKAQLAGCLKVWVSGSLQVL